MRRVRRDVGSANEGACFLRNVPLSFLCGFPRTSLVPSFMSLVPEGLGTVWHSTLLKRLKIHCCFPPSTTVRARLVRFFQGVVSSV